jgi:hypothetical protein
MLFCILARRQFAGGAVILYRGGSNMAEQETPEQENGLQAEVAKAPAAPVEAPVAPALDNEVKRAKAFLAAALPLAADIVEGLPGVKKAVAKWNCAIQFKVAADPVAAYVQFEGGAAKVVQGAHEKPIITLTFKTSKAMNDFFTGKMVLPKISGMSHIIILMTFLMKIMMKMKMLMPSYKCKSEGEKVLKVQMLLSLVAFAMQEMTVMGDDYIGRLTKTARKKIVEWTVIPDGPAAWIRIDEGKITANKGRTDRRPYVAMDFVDINAALKVLTSEVGALEASKLQLVKFRGTAEYGIKVGNLMTRVNNFLMPDA